MQFIQQFINGLTLGAIYALIALGYTMVYGVMRLINFAHGDVYMLGAYAGLFAAGWFGVNRTLEAGATPGFLSISLVFLASMAICAIIGVIIERFAYRPLRNSSRLAALITAIGVSMFIEYGGQAIFSPDPRQFPTLIPHKTLYSSTGFDITLAYVLVVALVSIIILGLQFIITKTRFGRAVHTISHNRIAPFSQNISANIATSLISVLISALMAFVTAIGVSMFIPHTILYQAASFDITLLHVLVVAVVLIIILGVQFIAAKTRVGHSMRAILYNRIATSRKSINANTVISSIFTLISALVAFAITLGVSMFIPHTVLYEASGFAITLVQVLIVGVAFALMLGLQIIITRTKIGRAMRAVSHDRVAASLMGINTDAVISFTFALGSALAAAGGVLNSLYTPKIDPLIGLMIGIKAFVAAVLGGIGSIPGAVLGALLLGFAETATVAAGKSEYRDAIAFAILIGVLLLRPTGLLGKTKAEKV